MWQNNATWLDHTVQCGRTRLVYTVHQTLPFFCGSGSGLWDYPNTSRSFSPYPAPPRTAMLMWMWVSSSTTLSGSLASSSSPPTSLTTSTRPSSDDWGSCCPLMHHLGTSEPGFGRFVKLLFCWLESVIVQYNLLPMESAWKTVGLHASRVSLKVFMHQASKGT